MEVSRPPSSASGSLLPGGDRSDVEVPPRGSSYRNSELVSSSAVQSGTFDASMRGSTSFAGGAFRATEMKLTAVDPEMGSQPERTKDYKGRIRVRGGGYMKVTHGLCVG